MNNLWTTVQFPYLPWTYQSELVRVRSVEGKFSILLHIINRAGVYLHFFIEQRKTNC